MPANPAGRIAEPGTTWRARLRDEAKSGVSKSGVFRFDTPWTQ
jgi:hypothetical protein